MTSGRDPARAIPVLASLNIAATEAYYVEQLGFATTIYKDNAYLIVRRGEIELHFWLTDNPIHPQNTSCYIRGGEVARLHAEYEARGVPGLSPFLLRDWNMMEFYILDVHGNLLKFGCAPEELV